MTYKVKTLFPIFQGIHKKIMNTLNKGYKSNFDFVWPDIKAAGMVLDKALGIGNQYQRAVDLFEMIQWIP